MNLILNRATQKLAEAFITSKPHALLISGKHGVGVSSLAHTIAKQWSSTVITVLPEKDDAVDLDKGTISVQLIRRLYEQTRTTISGRVIIIDYAERMAPTAQNAFLKLLEEPGTGTSFILASHETTKLLPTIHSRVQHLHMSMISTEQSTQLLDSLGVTEATKRTQLLYMAAGLPAELTRLASDDAYFSQCAQIVRDARDILQGSTYAKLVLAHKYKDKRSDSLKLLDIAITMLRQTLSNQPQQAVAKKLDQLLDTYERIASNGNIRLQLAKAML